jgi:hypothetical protein
LPLSAASKRLRNRRYIKTLNQKMITTCWLPIAIEHGLPNYPTWKKVIFKNLSLISRNRDYKSPHSYLETAPCGFVSFLTYSLPSSNNLVARGDLEPPTFALWR